MTAKSKNRYLYLALACFLGIIAIFVVDGYMGVYDTVHLTTGEMEQTIEPDVWLRPDNFWSTGASQGETILFRYQVDNHTFSTYSANVAVSLWRSQQKLRDVLSQPLTVAPWQQGELAWAVNTLDVVPGDLAQGDSYQFTVVIQRGDQERRVIVYVNNNIKIPPPVR